MDIDKLVAQSSLSIRQCQRQRLFRLGAVFGEKWDTILLSPGRNKFIQMSKFMTHFVRHKDVGREEDAGVRIVEECKDVLSDDSIYWSDEIKERLKMAPYWSADKSVDVLDVV